MGSITNIFNNREIVSILLLSSFIIWAFSKKDIRKSFFSALALFFKPKIFIVYLLMTFYVLGIIYFLVKIGFWNVNFIKDSIFWYFGVAIVMLMNSNKANENENYFRDIIFDNLKLILILEFIINFYTFPIIIELFFVPFVIIVGILYTFSDFRPQYLAVKKILINILSLIGIILIIHAVYNIVKDISVIGNFETLKSFVYPIIMTLLLLPFIYMFALVMSYELLFTRLEIFNTQYDHLPYAKKKIFLHFKFNLKKLNKFSRSGNIVKIKNKEDVYKVISDYN